MAETKIVKRLEVIVDSETSYDKCGDIEFTLWPEGWLEKHIRNFGAQQLINAFSSELAAIYNAKIAVEEERQIMEHVNMSKI